MAIQNKTEGVQMAQRKLKVIVPFGIRFQLIKDFTILIDDDVNSLQSLVAIV